MRGLTKAAAWLLPALATTLVIPTDELNDAIFSSNLGANPTNPTDELSDAIFSNTLGLNPTSPTDEISDAIFSSTLGANPTNPTEPAPNIIDYRKMALA